MSPHDLATLDAEVDKGGGYVFNATLNADFPEALRDGLGFSGEDPAFRARVAAPDGKIVYVLRGALSGEPGDYRFLSR